MKRKIISGIMTGVLMCSAFNCFSKENEILVSAEENEKMIYANTINYECCDWTLKVTNLGNVTLSRTITELNREGSKMIPIITSEINKLQNDTERHSFRLKNSESYKENKCIYTFERPYISMDDSIGNTASAFFHIPETYFDETVTLYFFDEEININITEENLEKEKIKGDINNDGKIDSSDASYILKYYALASTGQTPTWSEILNN